MQKPLSRPTSFRHTFLLAFALAFMYAATPARGAPVEFGWYINPLLLHSIETSNYGGELASSTIVFYIVPSLYFGYVGDFADTMDFYFKSNPNENGYVDDYMETELVMPYHQMTMSWDDSAKYINGESEFGGSFSLDDTEVNGDLNVFVFFVIQKDDGGFAKYTYGHDAHQVIVGYSPFRFDEDFILTPGGKDIVGSETIDWPTVVEGVMYIRPQVPEPSTGVMALAGLALLLKRRRK